MLIMKRYIFILIVLFNLLQASSVNQKLPYNTLISLVKSIDNQVITIGNGDVDVYAFIDPLCKYSRKFLKTVTSNEMMLKKYKYHLFMYEIPRLNSQNIIYSIYAQKDKKTSLLDVMLHGKKLDIQDKDFDFKKQKDIVDKISKVAKQIGVFKRPYIIISKKKK